MHEALVIVAAVVGGGLVAAFLVLGTFLLFPRLNNSNLFGFLCAELLTVLICGILGGMTGKAVTGILVGYAIPLTGLVMSGIGTTIRKVPRTHP